jgi:tetratricopeptide (TPR) repeat protein
MAEQEPNDKSQEQEPGAGGAPPTPARKHRSRPRALTPEQRRLLGTPRLSQERVETEPATESDVFSSPEKTDFEPASRRGAQTPAPDAPSQSPSPSESKAEERKSARLVVKRRRNDSLSRATEMQHAALIIGGLLVLGFTFYFGKKFDYWRYLLAIRNKPKMVAGMSDKFEGIPADTLIEQALADERGTHWRDAAERLLAAKDKNPKYRGILLRVGKIAYDHGDFDRADRLLAHAVASGENVDTANYFRGLIAMRHRDLIAAERFFEAAVTAEPFNADYYYHWGEALRLDHHPREAIPRYEQAQRRARRDQDVTVCRFKVRMARLEAGDAAKLKAEIEKSANTAPPALDWLMTSAALAIYEGRIDDAVRTITEARNISQRTADGDGIFVSCTGDMVFQDACRKHHELAQVCQTGGASPVPLP